MHNWDDLRYFLAVARAGSLTAASAGLGVNQSTVSRRIYGFEQELKVRLFERFPSGYVLTPEGEELLLRAQRIEEEAYAIDRNVMGKNVELSGPIRVTCSLAIARYLLIPMLTGFHRMHPGIVIHLDLSSSLYNLSSREADVAIRVTRDAVPETLIGRELGRVEYGVYGRKDYVNAYRSANDDAQLHWIGEDNDQDRPAWLPPDIAIRLVMRTNDVLATLEVLNQGLGVGRLPRFMAEKARDLLPLELGRDAVPAIPIWLLTHADMRRVNRVSVFNAYIAESFRKRLDYR